jgi:hypothetical protein
MGSVFSAALTILMHLGPNVAGAGWSIYQNGLHIDYPQHTRQQVKKRVTKPVKAIHWVQD